MFCSPGIHSVNTSPKGQRQIKYLHATEITSITCDAATSQLVLRLYQGCSVEQIIACLRPWSQRDHNRSHWIHCRNCCLHLLSRQTQRRSSTLHTCVDWGQDEHKAALTGVGVYGEIRLALQYAVDKFSAVPVHRIVGICRCYPSNRGTCETEGQSQSVCSFRQSLRDTERMTWDFEIRSKSLLKQASVGFVCKWNK